jgi:hypothetical protein
MTELRDAFRGGWRALIIVVPVVSALVAGYLFYGSDPAEWESTGEFSIREFAPSESLQDVRATVASFETALESRRVRDEVTAASGDQPITLPDVRSTTEGGDVEVGVVAATPEIAERALQLGVRSALTIVAQAESRRAERQLLAADAAAEDFIQTLLELEQRAGVSSIDAEVERRSADILQLRNQIASAEGSAAVQDALRGILEEKQAELAVIEAELLPWSSTRARLDLAVASGADAALRIRQIQTGLDDLQQRSVLAAVRTYETSQLPDLLRVVVGAGAGAGLVIVVLALLARPHRRRDDGDDAPGTTRRPVDDPSIWQDTDADVGPREVQESVR